MPNTRILTTIEPEYSYQFSICTIVNDQAEYQEMVHSFEQCGFRDDCEYLVADNTQGNTFDAYQAIAAFLKQASGRYLIIVHQDVRCLDTKAQLLACLENLTAKDARWALCGNAGVYGYHAKVMHLHNAGEIIMHENLPAQVNSLDENLLIVNRSANLSISGDLSGFHLYGTDLCLVADILGYTSYVIPFMVNHLSKGNLKALEEHIPLFWSAYGRKLRSRYIETTCTKFYLSNSVWKNKVYNGAVMFGLVKLVQRLKQIGRLLSGTSRHKRIR